jgi:hypothetical protein
MENRNMKQHVSFVGALHIGFGILGLLGALTIFIIFNFAQGFAEVEAEPFASEILSFLGGSISLVIMFFALLGIIGGIGLLSYKNWARILVLIVSAVNCLNIPIGTAKGIYSIWVLINKETMELFDLS